MYTKLKGRKDGTNCHPSPMYDMLKEVLREGFEDKLARRGKKEYINNTETFVKQNKEHPRIQEFVDAKTKSDYKNVPRNTARNIQKQVERFSGHNENPRSQGDLPILRTGRGKGVNGLQTVLPGPPD